MAKITTKPKPRNSRMTIQAGGVKPTMSKPTKTTPKPKGCNCGK